MAGRFSIEAIFKAIDKVTAPVTRMQNRMSKFTRSMNRGLTRANRNFKKLSASIKRGAVVSGAALFALGAGIRNIMNVGADFGRAIGSAAAKFPDKIKRGTIAFKDLALAARQVGKTTEFTATQAAGALNFLAKAGFDAKFSMKSLASIVDFATASEIDLATAADIASDAIGAFGMNVKDPVQRMTNMNRVMDVMGKSANMANMGVEELFETVKGAAPIAIRAGMSIETFSAVASVLAGAGIKGTQAATGIKNISLAMAGLGGQADAIFKTLKIPLQVDGKMRDIADVFEDLDKATKNMGEKEILEVMNGIFGKISLASAANLLGKGTDDIRRLRKVLEGAGGSMKQIAGFIRNDVKGSLDSLDSAIEGVKISIFSLNEGPLKEAIDKITDWISVNEELIAGKIGNFLLSLVNNFENIVKWAKRIGKALVFFFALGAILKTLVTIMTLVNLVMAANPITLIILGIVAAIAAIGALIFWWDEIVSMFTSMPAPIQAAMAAIFWPITLLISAAKLLMDNWEPLGEFFAGLWDGIVSTFSWAFDFIMPLVETIMGALGKLWSALDAGAAFLGFSQSNDDDEEEKRKRDSALKNPIVLGSQARAAQSLIENHSSNSSEVTIRAGEGASAEVTKGRLGFGVQLEPSGGFG